MDSYCIALAVELKAIVSLGSEEQELLESSVMGRVRVDVAEAALSALRPNGAGVGDGRQRGGLVPGHVDDGVDEEENESKLGEDLVVLRGHERLLGQFGGRWRR